MTDDIMLGYYCADCMEYLPQMPDNAFDLAIVDPPYGIGVGSLAYTNGVARVGNALANRRDYRHPRQWDIRPSSEYFDELLRVSKRAIIWGGNYFTDHLPTSKSWFVWDKRTQDNLRNDFADAELAWCSPGMGVVRVYRYLWNGMLQGDMRNKEQRFHPTQKPTALYKWLLANYAKKGDKILDTHVGSASSLIACEEMGFQYLGFEIDPDYYDKSRKRLDEFNAQMRMEL